jgi:transposase InsO family protein
MLVVAFAHWAAPQGFGRAHAADRLGVRLSTLARWDRQWNKTRMILTPLGRPQRILNPLEHLEVIQHVEALGPATGLSPLRAMFPHVTRSSLRDVQMQFRRQWRDEHSIETEELVWTTPGTVWAGDFTDPPAPIDGCFRHILTTRDLPSHMNILAMPTPTEDAHVACAAAESLFFAHGPPLVYKLDNGSAFISQVFRALLEKFGVILLLSPPRLPRYNGSAEAGNGSLKTCTHYKAVANGRAGRPTSDDVAEAQGQLNSTSRPWGPSRPTPIETWQSRTPITLAQRDDFRHCVSDSRHAVLRELGVTEDELKPKTRPIVDRAAVRRALETLGYLTVRRRRITPPLNSQTRDRIS